MESVNSKQEIRQFVIDNFLFGAANGHLSDDTPLMEEGIIDSTGVMELVFFLEQQFHIKVADEDLLPDNLDSINLLNSFLTRKLAVGR